jgi:hypothetical protein
MDLKEWSIIFLEQRKKLGKIKELNINDSRTNIKNNDNIEQEVKITDSLEALNIKELKDKTIIITKNNKKNLKFLIDKWKDYVSKEITIYFANTKTNEKWVVNTKVHDFITDEKNIKKSLTSLSSTVPEDK